MWGVGLRVQELGLGVWGVGFRVIVMSKMPKDAWSWVRSR